MTARHTRIALGLLVVLCCATVQAGDLDGLIDRINVAARADLGNFKGELRVTFGKSDREIDGLFKIFKDPADVYMTLRIGELSKQPLDRVCEEYQAHSGQGWGVIAKNLGIKPGSAEFHALKQNRMASEAGGSGDGKPKSKGKGKG